MDSLELLVSGLSEWLVWGNDMHCSKIIAAPARGCCVSNMVKLQRLDCPALCQFTVGSILHLQRKSGMTGRTAASQHLVE